MRRSTRMWWVSSVLAAVLPACALAEGSPCADGRSRALVLGSGGAKGSFEAGAAYHLIVHRGCDFNEISGISAGALNAALLAQAQAVTTPSESLEALRRAAEALAAQWESLRSKEVLRSRPLGKLRLGIVGLQSLENLDPLREFVRSRVSLDRLAAGRELRVGTLSFVDGRYHEIVINAKGSVDRSTAHDLIFASMVVPVFGKMPVVASTTDQPAAERLQFGDAGLRHSVPITSYFQRCVAPFGAERATCEPLTGSNTPPHPRVEQLFVVVTSPYARLNDLRPVVDPKAVDEGTLRITDGRKILVRTFDLLIDTLSRTELDDALMYNDLLAWFAAERPPAVAAFPIGSYNRDEGTGLPLPYEITLIAPQREESDPAAIFEVDRRAIRRQLLCGCLAADETMRARFGVDGMAERCAERFLRPDAGGNRPPLAGEALACRDERTAVDVDRTAGQRAR